MGEEGNYLTREKLLGVRHHINAIKGLIVFAGALIILDLIYINFAVFNVETPEIQGDVPAIQTEKTKEDTEEAASAIVVEKVCDAACIANFEKEIASLKVQRVQSGALNVGGGTSSVKEYYVPFGSGVDSSSEWKDISGLEGYIDGNSYGVIKKATFEVSVRVPTGNQTVDVRLYNITAAHPVWFSEMKFTGGGTPQLLVSSPITIDSGNNLYRVQMKTQLKFQAFIDQARVRIMTN